MPHPAAQFRHIGIAFAAGFLSVLAFHQGGWALLYGLHVVPADRPPWSLAPVPPLAVPLVVSQSFWGGIWAILLSYVIPDRNKAIYWTAWTVAGAVVLTLVALLLVPAFKGLPVPPLTWLRFAIGALVNGLWGLGTAAILSLFGSASRQAGRAA